MIDKKEGRTGTTTGGKRVSNRITSNLRRTRNTNRNKARATLQEEEGNNGEETRPTRTKNDGIRKTFIQTT